MGWLLKLLSTLKGFSSGKEAAVSASEDVALEEQPKAQVVAEVEDKPIVKQESPVRKEQDQSAGSFGIQGVHSHLNVSYKARRAEQDAAQETGDEPNVVEGEVAEVYEDDQLGLGGGYVEGEIIEDIEQLKTAQLKMLSSGNEEDFIEADWEDLSGQDEAEALQLSAGEEFEDDLASAAKELIEVSDEFGLQAAEAFTDIVYEGEDSQFTDDTNIFDNDFVPNQESFIANAFEDQGVSAPIYPSEAMPWGAPSEASGFGGNRDEAFEAEFALGGDI